MLMWGNAFVSWTLLDVVSSKAEVSQPPISQVFNRKLLLEMRKHWDKLGSMSCSHSARGFMSCSSIKHGSQSPCKSVHRDHAEILRTN